MSSNSNRADGHRSPVRKGGEVHVKSVTGIIKSVIYSDRRFAIISVITDDQDDWVISGDFSGSIFPGMTISCRVISHNHPLYGEQYELVTRDVPDDRSRHLSAIYAYLANHDQMRAQANSIAIMLMDASDPLQQIVDSEILSSLPAQMQAQITMELSAAITLAEMGMDWVIPMAMSIFGPSAPTQVISAPGILLDCHIPWKDIYGLAMRLCDQTYVDGLIQTALQTQMQSRCQIEISKEDLAYELKGLSGKSIPYEQSGFSERDGVYVPWSTLRTCSILEDTISVKSTKTLFWPGDIDKVSMEAARKILSIVNISNLCVVDTAETPKALIDALGSFLSSHNISWQLRTRRDAAGGKEKISIITDAHTIPVDRLITLFSERTIIFGDSLLSLAGDGGFGLLYRGCDPRYAISLDDPTKRLNEVSVKDGWKKGAPVIRRAVSLSAKQTGYVGSDYGEFRMGHIVEIAGPRQGYVQVVCKETGVSGLIPKHLICDTMSIAFAHLIGMKLDYANLGFRPKSMMELYAVCANVKNEVYAKYPIRKGLPLGMPITKAKLRNT